MTNEVLSNAEIDALLKLFEADGIPEEILEIAGPDLELGKLSSGSVTEIDLLKPNRFTRDQLMIVERIQDVVAQKLGATLVERLRVEAACDCVAVEQMRFSTWMSQVEGPVAVYVLDIPPISMPALLTISTDLLLGIVDRVLGGSGSTTRSSDGAHRELSEAEYAVADSIVIPLIERIAEGISEIVPVAPEIVERYASLTMAQSLPFQEVVLASHFQFAGRPLLGDLRMVMTYSGLEPYIDRLATSRFQAKNGQSGTFRAQLEKDLMRVPLELGVELGRSELGLGELMDLSVGDIVPLSTHVGAVVDVPIQGEAKFRGVIGARGKRFAVRIEEVLE